MAAVSVFVDDAILGRLPMVCAKTGEPADLVIRMQRPVGMSWAIWLLVFLGPMGLVALVLLSLFGPGPEYLTVQVPRTSASFEREQTLQRSRWAAFFLAFGFLVPGALGVGMFPAMWLLLAAAALVAAGVLQAEVNRESVGVRLDASRRWVTLSGVHPHFAAAVTRDEATTGR